MNTSNQLGSTQDFCLPARTRAHVVDRLMQCNDTLALFETALIGGVGPEESRAMTVLTQYVRDELHHIQDTLAPSK